MRRRSWPPIVTTLALLGPALLISLPLGATTVIAASDRELADQAPVALVATIAAALPTPAERVPRSGLPTTDYRLRVERVLKGQAPRGALVLRVLGGREGSGLTLKVWGAPEFRPGERALLFLVPSADGSFRPLHLVLGAFRERWSGGRRLAVSDLSEVDVADETGGLRPGTVQVRDFGRFADWVAERAQGRERAADYLIEGAGPDPRLEYTYLSNQKQRWFEFDKDIDVHWTMYETGQPGLDDGGFGELQTAIGAWNGNPGTNIRYRYDGTSADRTGFLRFDGQNVLVPDDPNDDLPGSFTCSSPGNGSGLLAAGGTWFTAGGPEPLAIRAATIVIQDGAGCWFNHDGRRGEQIYTHELGHTLGLGHSCGDSASGACDTSAKNDALMRAQAHNDDRGASIRGDDEAGIQSLYGQGGGGTPPGNPPGGNGPGLPLAPGSLSARALSTSAVALAWQPGSPGPPGQGSASEIRIEARIGGAFQEIQIVPASSTGFDVTSLAPQTAYTFRVRAHNAAGFSGYSNEASAATLALPLPAAPSELSAAAQPASQVLLRWQLNSTDETRIEVEQSSPAAGFLRIAALPAATTTLLVSGLGADTPYTFRVRARNATGSSPFSKLASVTARTGSPPGPCAAAAETLCLFGGRFQVEVQWRNSATGEHGAGRVIPSSDQTGMFWFFDPANVELIVKLLDGRRVDGFFWTFYGGLSDVEYWISVADTQSGQASTYHNAAGNLCGAGDVRSLPSPSSASPASRVSRAPSTRASDRAAQAPVLSVRSPSATAIETALEAAAAPCAAGPATLCLLGGRFQVDVTWASAPPGASAVQGAGSAVPLTDQSGLFWFFSADNIELVVKVLDGRPVNGRFWLFYGALSDVRYDLRITDTATGAVRTYHNAAGNLCGLGDTSAF
ncbi:MAG TPA: fibronectin type III domain-containing protein [Thermoanaerobaculia bacterium]|nr:fibronectin type III domain-containing protein [Thermoanaerobaculia bacterium]